MAKIINVVSQTSVKVNTSLDKEELKNLNQVSSHPTFSNEGNWRLVIGVFKHTNSRRRMVCAFKESFNSLVPMRIRSGTQAGDAYELRKILIVGQNNQGILSIPRSDIASVSDYDFVIGEVAAPENFSATISSEAAASVYASFNSSVSFNKSVSNFNLNKLSIINGTASNLTGSGTNYSFTVTPTGEGQVTISILAGQVSAADGSVNVISNSLQRQYYAPVSASMSTASGSNSFSEPFTVNVVFNKSVINFDIANITVTNGSASNFNGSDAEYSFLVTPNQDGQVSIELDMSDVVGQDGSTAPTPPSSINASYISPLTVSMSSEASTTVNGPFTIYVTFNKSVTGFELGDISITNGVASNLNDLTGSGTNYSFTVTPSADGAVSASIISGSAQGPSGENSSGSSSPITTTYVDLKTLYLDNAGGTGTGSVYAYLNNQLTFGVSGNAQSASYDFDPGADVELRAEASFNNYFAGYNGSATSSANNINIAMNADKNISASFYKSFNETYRTSSYTSYNVKVKILPSGKIALYGDIESFDNTNSRGLIILNQNKNVDENFSHGGFNGLVYDVAEDSNGYIWVVGGFTTYFGPVSSDAAANGFNSSSNWNANRIAKLNGSGVLQLISPYDTSTIQGNGLSGIAYCVAVDSSDNVWVGGSFNTFYQGVAQTNNANNLLKLNSSGLLQKVCDGDSAGGSANGFGGTVYSIKIDSSSNLWIGGDFREYYGDTYYGQRILGTAIGNNANGLAKLNSSGILQKISSSDTNSGTGNGFSWMIQGVRCINIDSQGNIWVGGGFDRYYGVTYSGGNASTNARCIAKLNGSGVLQKINSADLPGSSNNGFDGTVNCIEFDSTGNIWIGGAFGNYRASGTANARCIAKLNSLGTLVKINSADSAGLTSNGFNNEVSSIAINANDDVWVAGKFNSCYIYTGSNLKLQTPYLCFLIKRQDPLTYEVIHCNDYSLVSARYVNQEGLETLNLVSAIGFTDTYKAKILSSGKMAIFGQFVIHKEGKIYKNLAILDITSDSDFDLDPFFAPCQFNATVNDVVEDASGNIWVVGNFTTFTGYISSSAASSGFTSGATNNANRIAKLNSSGVLEKINSSDTVGATGNGFSADADCIVLDNGTLWVGGVFTGYKADSLSYTANRLARINPTNGTLVSFSGDSNTQAGNGFYNGRVYCITIIGNTVWLGGTFTGYKSTLANANRIAKIDRTTGVLSAINSGDSPGAATNGFNGHVRCITNTGDGFIWVGGRFTNYKASLTSAGNANLIAKINTSTGALSAINSGDTSGVSGNGFDGAISYLPTGNGLCVQCITKDSQGNIWVGGNFISYVSAQAWGGRNVLYNAGNARRIAKINSSGQLVRINNSDTNLENGFDVDSATDYLNEVLSIVEHANQDLYVGTHRNLNRYLGDKSSKTSSPLKRSNWLVRPFIKLYGRTSLKLK